MLYDLTSPHTFEILKDQNHERKTFKNNATALNNCVPILIVIKKNTSNNYMEVVLTIYGNFSYKIDTSYKFNK